MPTIQDDSKIIMLIDDNDLVNMMHQALLKSYFSGNSVFVYNSPQTALEWLQHRQMAGEKLPDLILLDIDMPQMNGWELLEELRKHKILIKVCMLSSSIDPQDVETSKRFKEVLKYFSKPLTANHIPTLKQLV
ncbi:MAG: response regulator [Bacteroidia bacterium]|nr:response regulator [Bacteroidia bacterium]